jgi:serine/threonine-protein kinase
VQTIQRAVRPLPAERFDIDEMREELRDILRTLPYTSPNRGRVLFALHGIRTHAAWQKALMEVAHMQQWNCRTFLWSYGYVSLLQFLLPWQRTRKIERFRDTYDLEVRNKDVNLTQGQLPSIVAHSFGTYILGQALLAYRHIRFDKVILCGSILPCDFPWDHLIARGQVKAIRNEYGQKDAWPGIVPWFVNDTGPSGRAGFATPCHPDRLEQEEFFVSHSAYFDKGHVEDAWFPFLNRTVPERLAATPVSTVRRSTNRPVALYLLIVLLAAAAVLSGLKLYWLLTSLL